MGTAKNLEKHPGAVPALYSSGLKEKAFELSGLLSTGHAHMTELFQTEPPRLRAMLLDETDWRDTPREAGRPYPFGLPYFTRAAETPTLVFPAALSDIFQPRTDLTFPLAAWHELAHAFFLSREVVKTPLWLGEFVPQAAAAAVALREGASVGEHLSQVEKPDFTVRGFTLPATAEEQMRFQNLLLSFSVAIVRQFGDGFLSRLVRSVWGEEDVVSGERAESLFVESLGSGGREWVYSREDF